MMRVLALLVTGLLSAAAPAVADQNNAKLDGLFDRLRATTNAAEALVIEHTIWRIWIKHDAEHVNRSMARGIEAMNRGALDASLNAFNEVILLDPGFAEGWNKRATVYYMMGDFDRSVGDIQKTLMLEPRHFGALSGMGLIYDAIGDGESALKIWEKALSIHPHMRGIKGRVDELREKARGEAT